MKRLVLFFLVVLFLSFKYVAYLKSIQVVVGPESNLVIKGKTNVNRFYCKFDASNLKNPIPVYFQMEDEKMLFKETHLVLNTRCFDCGNKRMNEDFYELLNADVYPEIILNLRSVNINSPHENKVFADISIAIAGVVNTYKVPLQFKDNDTMVVSGILNLNITDFDIKPPRKVMGLIVVSEFIKIDLNLNIIESQK